jgi:serine phosphatase RsbU (regulator of sigma subunit)
LELAADIQAGLLRPRTLAHDGRQVSYHYEAASLVSGDYCDEVKRGTAGEEYGTARLQSLICEHKELLPADLIRACLGDLDAFCAGAPRHDDLTVMALRRS